MFAFDVPLIDLTKKMKKSHPEILINFCVLLVVSGDIAQW